LASPKAAEHRNLRAASAFGVGRESVSLSQQSDNFVNPLKFRRIAAKMGSILVDSTTSDDYPSKVPKPGVWCPAVTFFNPATDQLDLHVQAKYYSYLSRSGLTGLVILGTNAETLLLTREERAALLATARKAVGPDYPIMAGVGGHSTKQVLEYIADAHNAGANYALVLPAAYFGKQTTPSVITRFYDEVAEKSSLPIVIYNFPAVCNGVDLDSETITTIAKKHKNVVGVKLTCASVGKIVRLAASLKPEEFSTFGGQSDFLIGGLSSGSAGCIAAFANIFPRTIARIYDLYKAGHYEEALKLHQQAALAENPVKAGIAAVKYGVSLFSAKAAGVENAEELLQPRRPYEALSDAMKKKVKEALTAVNEVELKLQSTKA
jgi:4-hydroxy-2-oxoglutarate aldolase